MPSSAFLCAKKGEKSMARPVDDIGCGCGCLSVVLICVFLGGLIWSVVAPPKSSHTVQTQIASLTDYTWEYQVEPVAYRHNCKVQFNYDGKQYTVTEPDSSRYVDTYCKDIGLHVGETHTFRIEIENDFLFWDYEDVEFIK
jgi:hypothetical protein